MLYISTNSKDFPYEEARKLYEDNKKYFLPLDISFDALIEGLRGNLWAVTVDNIFIGCIYFEQRENKWFLSGVSVRKQYKYIPQAIEGLCKLYFEQTDAIYSETEHKWAKEALKRADFIQLKENLFRKERNKCSMNYF